MRFLSKGRVKRACKIKVLQTNFKMPCGGGGHGAPSAVGALKIACKGLISQERFGPSFEGKRYEIK